MGELRGTGHRIYGYDLCLIKSSCDLISWRQTTAMAATTTSATLSFPYSARVADGSSNAYSYSSSTNTWIVYDKKGTKYIYGSDDGGRMYDTSTGTSTKTYRWYLQEVRDTNDNYIRYTYSRDNNVLYPDVITYTGHGSTDGISTVTFATSTRTDTRVSHASGFAATTNKVISEIDAAVNGSVVRKYLLGYGVGDNGYRSLLTSVQEEGYDDDNLTTLPPTTFSYATSSAQFVTPGATRIANAAFVVADSNGNGINDVHVFGTSPYDGTIYWNIYYDNTGNMTSLSNQPDSWATNNNDTDHYYPSERGVRMVDVNNDGKADVIQGLESGASNTFGLYLNTYSTTTGAYGWTASSTYSGSIPKFAVSGGAETTGIFGDFNGDGLPDFSQNVPGTGRQNTYLGNGLAWDATTTIFAPQQDFSSPEAASQFIDINGDGLDDWVYSDSAHIYVLLNTGTGWNSSPSPQWTIATSTLYRSPNSNTYYDRGIRFMDINGDGLPDFVRAYRLVPVNGQLTGVNAAEIADVKTVYLNTGNGWATSTAYTLPQYIADGIVTQFSLLFTGKFYHYEYANFNGNGQMNQDVLSTVTYPKGGSVNVAYSIATSTNSELPFPLLTVNAMATNDGHGIAATTTYSYSGGKLHLVSGVRDRKFAGFLVSTTTAPDSVVATYYDQGDGASAVYGEQSDGYGQINHPFRKDVFDLSNNIKQRTYFRWDTVAHGGSTFVGLGRELTQDFGADGSHRDKATAYMYSSTTDDLLQKIEYGEVTGASDGTFTDVGTDKRTTVFSYVGSSSVNMSLPIRKTSPAPEQ